MKDKMPIKEMLALAEIMKMLSGYNTKAVYNILLNVVCHFIMQTAKPGRKESALKDFHESLEECLGFYMDEKVHENISIKLAQLLEKHKTSLEEEVEEKTMPNLDHRFN